MNAEDLHTFLRTRRSIRRFADRPVPPETLTRILQTALLAPSAHNLQPWRLVQVDSPSARRTLAAALTAALRADMEAQGAAAAEIEARVERSRRRIAAAPVVLLYCRETAAVRRPDDPQEAHMGVQSVANVMLYTLLAAHAEGLGGNWICWPLYAGDAVQRALDLPPGWQPEGMLFLGYPAESPAAPRREPLETVLRRL